MRTWFRRGFEALRGFRASTWALVTDVPITFQERVAGESKLSMKQNVLYLRQLLALYWFKFKLTLLALVAALVAVACFVAQKLLG